MKCGFSNNSERKVKLLERIAWWIGRLILGFLKPIPSLNASNYSKMSESLKEKSLSKSSSRNCESNSSKLLLLVISSK